MQAFVVLVTDFANVHEVYGPFASRTSAVRWADENLEDVYRVFPMASRSATAASLFRTSGTRSQIGSASPVQFATAAADTNRTVLVRRSSAAGLFGRAMSFRRTAGPRASAPS